MAFSTQRGRPRKAACETDLGTPELRLKHALGLTTEPIDLCLERQLISEEQHWCGLHLRWLYTLRYGAPSLTTHYTDLDPPPRGAAPEDLAWRAMREQEYNDAARALKAQRHYEPVMRLAVFNERPAFLSEALRAQAWQQHHLATELAKLHTQLRDGLELLVQHWRRKPRMH